MIAELEAKLSRRLSVSKELRHKLSKSRERRQSLEHQSLVERSHIESVLQAANTRAKVIKFQAQFDRTMLYTNGNIEWQKRKLDGEQRTRAEREHKEQVARMLVEAKQARWTQNHSRIQESQSEQRLHKQLERRRSHEKVSLNRSMREHEFNNSMVQVAESLHAREERANSNRLTLKQGELQQLFLKKLENREKTFQAQQQKELQQTVKNISLQKNLQERQQIYSSKKSLRDLSKAISHLEKIQLATSRMLQHISRKHEIDSEEQKKLDYLESLTNQRIQEVLRNKTELEAQKRAKLEYEGSMLRQTIRDKQTAAGLLEVA
jgi:hypothetical protein